MRRPASLAFIPLLIVLDGCDNEQAFHTPEPGLERMLVQPRGAAYGASTAFPDGRVMRAPVPDTVPSERPWLGHRPVETGRDKGGYVSEIPLPVTRSALQKGRVAFERVCATCHGVLGDGHSVVAEKMELRKPPSLHEARIARLPPGKIFEISSLGYGLMPSFAAQLDVEQRWNVVAYLEALRLSQAVPAERLPETLRAKLEAEAP